MYGVGGVRSLQQPAARTITTTQTATNSTLMGPNLLLDRRVSIGREGTDLAVLSRVRCPVASYLLPSILTS
jgi:hypothetical protein